MFILFDIGGTKTRVACTRDLETVDEIVKFDTPVEYKAGIGAVITAIDTVRKGIPIQGIAGGIRGPLNHEKTKIISESKLTDWVGRPLASDLERACQVPVFLENDSAIVGLGEANFGAGKGHSIVAYHTVSTGVGGARFIDGHIDKTSAGFEPGHQVLDLDRTILGPGVPPTLENLTSGTALEHRRGMKPYEIHQSDHVWGELASYLASGLKNTIVYWSPDIIVLGGSMIVGDPRILLSDIQRHTKAALGGLLPCPPIVDAVLKDEGGIYGAMTLLKQKL